jgi:predicted HicB family RNase H-like nuclease
MEMEKKIPFQIRIPESLLSQIREKSKQESRSMNNYIIFHLEEAIKGEKK